MSMMSMMSVSQRQYLIVIDNYCEYCQPITCMANKQLEESLGIGEWVIEEVAAKPTDFIG